MTHTDSPRSLAVRLADAARDGAHEYVADVLAMLAAPGSARLPAVLAHELIELCARRFSEHRVAADPEIAYGFVVENERAEPVDVDTLPPGPRAALRALVATLNDDDSGREIQLDLATRGSPKEIVTVLVHCLVWTIELSAVSAARPPQLSCYPG
jgi:aminopeptidase N